MLCCEGYYERVVGGILLHYNNIIVPAGGDFMLF